MSLTLLDATPPIVPPASSPIDIENVAPFVTWLCTDEAAGVNGQEFLVSAEQVSLMSQPRPTETVFTAEPWTVDKLAELLPASVTRNLKPPSGG